MLHLIIQHTQRRRQNDAAGESLAEAQATAQGGLADGVGAQFVAEVEGLPEAAVDRIRANAAAGTPLKAASTPDDIAAATVFLASRASRHVTGETLLVDAGSHLGFAPQVAR